MPLLQLPETLTINPALCTWQSDIVRSMQMPDPMIPHLNLSSATSQDIRESSCARSGRAFSCSWQSKGTSHSQQVMNVRMHLCWSLGFHDSSVGPKAPAHILECWPGQSLDPSVYPGYAGHNYQCSWPAAIQWCCGCHWFWYACSSSPIPGIIDCWNQLRAQYRGHNGRRVTPSLHTSIQWLPWCP